LFKSYTDSTACVGTPFAYSYLSATCYNENGGGSYSFDSAGVATTYTSSGCTGTGVVDTEAQTTGCTIILTDDVVVDDYDDDSMFVIASVNVEYVSPAAHWTINVGLAALLASVACLAI
jgi:hypothetical protein